MSDDLNLTYAKMLEGLGPCFPSGRSSSASSNGNSSLMVTRALNSSDTLPGKTPTSVQRYGRYEMLCETLHATSLEQPLMPLNRPPSKPSSATSSLYASRVPLQPKTNQYPESISTDLVKKSALQLLYDSRPAPPDSANFTVIKMSNISWETMVTDIQDFFKPSIIPHAHVSPHFTQCIHIIMSRTTGKTLPVCYVEFPTMEQAQQAIHYKTGSRSILKGRHVSVEMSSQTQLFKSLFPNYRVMREGTDIENGLVFMIREEIFTLLNGCRAIRSRSPTKIKCIDRPYDNIISILSKIPWNKAEQISTLQRDHLFEMIKLAIEAIKTAANPKEFGSIMSRLVRTGLCVPLFTEKQKLMLLNSAHMQCPKELVSYVYTPEEPEEATRSPSPAIHPPSPQNQYKQALIQSIDNLTVEVSHARVLSTADVQGRIIQAEKLVFSLRQDNELLSSKYQGALFEAKRVTERYTELKKEYKNLERLCFDMQYRSSDTLDTLKPIQSRPDLGRSFSTGQFDLQNPSADLTSHWVQSQL